MRLPPPSRGSPPGDLHCTAPHERHANCTAPHVDCTERHGPAGPTVAVGNDSVKRYISDRSQALANQALWSQVQDIANAALSGDIFEDIVGRLTMLAVTTWGKQNDIV